MQIDIKEKENFLQMGSYYLSVIENIRKKYNGDFFKQINDYQKLHDILYCKNSSLPMGIFCPCPVVDIVVRKTRRGMICKKKPHGNDIYIYYFQNDRIKMIENGPHFFLFFYNENKNNVIVYECTQTKADKLFANLTECIYDEYGRIKKYLTFKASELNTQTWMLHMFDCKPATIKSSESSNEYTFNITEKNYFYSDDKLSKMKQVEFSSVFPSLSLNSYEFTYKNGYYSDYKINKTEYKPSIKREFNEFLKFPRYSDFGTNQGTVL